MIVSFMTLFVDISHATAMIIGFTERSRTVSESMAPPGADTFPLLIPLVTLRRAERDHPMNFRLQSRAVSSTTAIVEPIGEVVNVLYDATFGLRDNIGGPINEFFVLEALEGTIPSLITSIRDDLRPEDEECFTIRVLPVDVPGRRERFTCNEDDSGADNYFCEHTICIMDDDGRFAT